MLLKYFILSTDVSFIMTYKVRDNIRVSDILQIRMKRVQGAYNAG